MRARIHVTGIVQGVGFRPFVHGLAGELGLSGFVGNDTTGVVVEVEGAQVHVAEFVRALRERPPPLAVVSGVATEEVPATGVGGFRIAPSEAGGRREALVSADTATCEDCLREVFDPADRRHRYPFTNCTNCGPRFTIVVDVPYDRVATTMAGFAMCEQCAAEYHDPADRRFHAQPTCCPACGPALRLFTASGEAAPGDPLVAAADWLRAGKVVAVKGLGGYHLAALADCEPAVAAVRTRKHREDKPFAVMARDLAAVRRLARLDDAEQRVLTSRRRPIVLLARHPDAPLAPSVAPGNRSIGVMLPYTPLHHLLAAELAAPFVLTSGNLSDEPIAYVDEEAARRLTPIADAFLTHDRPIHIRADDSVVRVLGGRELPVRRSRGYAPEPLPLGFEARRPVLGCGAELKSTFCLATGRRAFLSHHIGDLENYETLRSYTEGVRHYRRLFDVEPVVVAHDLHPEYLSTKYAVELDDMELVGVQHHHAHIASCLADNGEAGPVIGIACDGLGYGLDGTMWGGEILAADLRGFRRLAHLQPVPMPGGAAAIREPWRMAAAWLDVAYDGKPPAGLDVVARNAARWDAVTAVAHSGVGAPVTSSAGRLFDAVAALVGLRDRVNYEGQAAIELEQRVELSETGCYAAGVDGGVLGGVDLVRAVVDDVRRGVDAGLVAARFHNGLVELLARAAEGVRAEHGLATVALSGGVFQNLVLLERLSARLAAAGFRVLTHSRVPPNDAGISLGQVAVAAAREAPDPPA